MGAQAGYDKGVYWNSTPVSITGYDDNDERDLVDVTSTIHAGLQALIAAISRPSGNFTMVFDTVYDPAVLGIAGGAFGTITISTGGAPVTRSVRIAKVNRKSAVADAVRVNVDWKASVI